MRELVVESAKAVAFFAVYYGLIAWVCDYFGC